MNLFWQITIFAVWGILLFLYFATIFNRTVEDWSKLKEWSDIAVWSGFLVFQFGFLGLFTYVIIGLGTRGGSF